MSVQADAVTLHEGWAYGLDVKSSYVGLGLVDLATLRYRTQGVAWRFGWRERTLPLPVSLKQCRQAVVHFLEVCHASWPCATVAIERPSGRHPNPSLMAHWGVVTEATYVALGLQPHSYSGSGDWRKQLGLKDKKEDALAWAASIGLDVQAVGEDQAEGLGVAAAAASQVLKLRSPVAFTPWTPND